MKLKYKFIFLAIILNILLIGCEAQSELNRVGIVVAVAIDKGENEDIVFTSQVIRPGALVKDRASKEAAVELVSGEGLTIFEAIRNATQIFDRINYYAHTKVIVIDEEIAQKGILSYLDFFVRGKELRGYTWICIAKDSKARDIIGTKEGIANIEGIYLKDIIENQKFHNKGVMTSVIDFYRTVTREGEHPVLGVLQIDKTTNYETEEKESDVSDIVKLSETAVFNNDKLIGYLNEEETKGYNWISGKVDNASMILPSLIQKDEYVSIEVEKRKSKIRPKVDGDNISFEISVKVDATLVEEQSQADIMYPKDMLDYLDKIKKEANKKIEEEINKTIYVAQKDLESDIFGFGNELYKKNPKKWKEVKSSWESIFPYVETKVNVNIDIIGTDLKEGVFNIEK